MRDLESLKADEGALRKELESAGVEFRGRACKCPFHDDHSPSAGIYFKEGVWRFKCQGCGFGGTIIDVRAKLNQRTPEDEIRAMEETTARPMRSSPPAPPKIFPTCEAIAASLPNVEDNYKDLYADPDGRSLFAVIRWRNAEGKKAFTQCSATAGGWWMKAPAGLFPIANRAAIRKAETVVVVEGEKCVRALASIGIVATTSPGGALKAHLSDWTPLAGKTAILWKDLDAPDDQFPLGKGDEHMRQVQKILQALDPPARVMWFDPAPLELPVKGDAADAVSRYRKEFSAAETRAIIEDAIVDAEPVGVAAEYLKEIEATAAGKRRAIPLPWPQLSNAARALMPGKVTCVCAEGGAGKSIWLSDCLVDWYQSTPVRWAIYHLEDDRNFHLRRMHAQIEQNSNLMSNDWVEQNGAYAIASAKRYAKALEEMGRCVWEAPDDQVSLEMLVAWLEERARAGFEVCIIDPVTAVESSSRPWVEDLKFITKCKVIGRRYGTRIILVTHPRSGTKSGKGTHNDMAGGAAYPRFSHTVLWIERNDADVQFAIRTDINRPAEWLTPNRIVFIPKARNGPGAGRRIGFMFDPKTFRHRELGLILRESESSS